MALSCLHVSEQNLHSSYWRPAKQWQLMQLLNTWICDHISRENVCICNNRDEREHGFKSLHKAQACRQYVHITGSLQICTGFPLSLKRPHMDIALAQRLGPAASSVFGIYQSDLRADVHWSARAGAWKACWSSIGTLASFHHRTPISHNLATGTQSAVLVRHSVSHVFAYISAQQVWRDLCQNILIAEIGTNSWKGSWRPSGNCLKRSKIGSVAREGSIWV